MDRHSWRVAKAASPSAEPSVAVPPAPEAAARGAHVPVAEIVQERLQRAAGAGRVEVLQALRDLGGRPVEAGQDPAVHRAQRAGGRRGPAGGPAVGKGRVGHQERVGVPQREQEAAHGVVDRLEAEAERVPRALGGEQVPAEGVRPLAVEHDPGLDDVSPALAHLLTLGVEDQAEADDVAVGRLAEQQGALGEQGVEPAPGLVEGLADEVRRDAPGEVAAGREGMVVLRERHRAAVVPDVHDLGLAVHRAAAAAGQLHLVHEGAVGIEVLTEGGRRALAQLGVGADGVHAVTGPAAPQGQRRAPVTVARDRPVHVALEPLAEAAVAHALGVPPDARVELQHAVAHVGRADVPGGLGVVEQRRAAAPAVRIGVVVDLGAQQHAPVVEVGDEVRVGLLDQPAGPRADGVGEAPVGTDRVRGVEVVAARGGHVVLAEGGRDVDDAGAVVGRHEVGVHHPVGARQEGEGRVVLPAQELGPGDQALGTSALAEHPLHQRLGQDQGLVAHLDGRVGDLWVDRGGLIGRQRPGRGGPHQQAAGAVAQGEAHVGGGVVDVPVAEGHLVAREGRPAPRAVGNDLVAAIQQAPAEQLGEAPPDALDVAGVHRAVRAVGVDPEADPLGEALPLVEIGEHRLAAQGVEFGDAVGLDLGLARNAEPLLHLELDGQAVAVPAPAPIDETAPHGLEAGEDVLEDA